MVFQLRCDVLKLADLTGNLFNVQTVWIKTRREKMMKKLIIGVAALCSTITVVGSVFAIQSYNVKNSHVLSENRHYCQNIVNKITGYNSSEPCYGTDNNNKNKENNQEDYGDYLQGLIIAPMIITKTISENHDIICN